MAPNLPQPSFSSPARPALQGRRLWSGVSILSKRSFRSFATSSFEADDERSSSDDSMSRRASRDGDEGDGGARLGLPRYSGYDARPTSKRELAGWYMYGFAAETYVICGIGSFIPILLESIARENGVLVDDRSKPCGSSDSKKDDGQCVLYILGVPINTASFAMYTFSISVLMQAVLVVSISCAADHGNYRKKLLLAFAWIGSFSVMAFVFISKETYIWGALLTILSNTSFGASFVLLNSFLPLLVRNHPEVIEARGAAAADVTDLTVESGPLDDPTASSDSPLANSTSALLPDEPVEFSSGLKSGASHEGITSKELQLSTRISATGIGIGYGAGWFLQCISIGILIAMTDQTWAQRIVLLVVGAWWTIFTIPAAMWLRPRPGPPLVMKGHKRGGDWLAYFIYAWKSLFKTIKLARQLRDIMFFLAGWFLLSDAIATTSSTAILFAKTQLHMQPWALGMINVITTLAGVFGALGWSTFSRLVGLQTHQTILVCIFLFELIPVYGLLGYLPFIQNWGVLGLQQPWEMYPLAAVYGLVLGGLSSYCRALYGELIPPGSEAAFYALYAITDKGSSVFGPTIVAAIIDKTESIRPAFWFLALLVGLPAPLIYLINVERGKIEGEKLARTMVKVDEDVHDEREAQGMLDGQESDDEHDHMD